MGRLLERLRRIRVGLLYRDEEDNLWEVTRLVGSLIVTKCYFGEKYGRELYLWADLGGIPHGYVIRYVGWWRGLGILYSGVNWLLKLVGI